MKIIQRAFQRSEKERLLAASNALVKEIIASIRNRLSFYYIPIGLSVLMHVFWSRWRNGYKDLVFFVQKAEVPLSGLIVAESFRSQTLKRQIFF